MNRNDIFKAIDSVNNSSPVYLKKHKANNIQKSNICPSQEFVNNLLKVCAKGLGFEYEERSIKTI